MIKYVIVALVFALLALASAISAKPVWILVWSGLALVAVAFGLAAKARGVRLEHEAARKKNDAEYEAFMDWYTGGAVRDPHVKWIDEQ